jgi:hypothetical protein
MLAKSDHSRPQGRPEEGGGRLPDSDHQATIDGATAPEFTGPQGDDSRGAANDAIARSMRTIPICATAAGRA